MSLLVKSNIANLQSLRTVKFEKKDKYKLEVNKKVTKTQTNHTYVCQNLTIQNSNYITNLQQLSRGP